MSTIFVILIKFNCACLHDRFEDFSLIYQFGKLVFNYYIIKILHNIIIWANSIKYKYEINLNNHAFKKGVKKY